ncbi:uncharacterized protein TRAVEDRAFT_53236 [Trametes versicolor FP-101664 SS1]|uniref:uncharacterized protein n=1 Tax=Trametes versicolor (strain FP-101664) TaxID=717944 RepID=UPI00046217EB|nr:uncharacterized protein TRAVEDRAFT_53236 [Trametes versicolor FP-101664 SS1]EIW52796.1 hypothetical protein TRAVEDRAFT_53236 [Trametes versicolor FP-101664 SS1]
MEALPFLRAELLSLLFEALLFGCFSILYPISLWMLVYRHRRDGDRYSRHGIGLFSIVTVMFFLDMTHLILSALDYVTMFADHSTTADGAYLFYLSGKEDGTAIGNMLLSAVVTLIGDGFMTYRVFIITVVSVGMLKYESQASGLGLGEALYDAKVYALMTTYFVLVLATNIVTVALIIGRLMWHERMVHLHDVDVLGPSIHRTVARTIIQSEALYSVTVGATLASYVARSDIFYVGSCMVPPLVGISFTLIITHVGFDDIKREISAANNADLSRLDFQRVVHSSGGDSSGSMIIAPSTLIVSTSGDAEKGKAFHGAAKKNTSASTTTRAGLVLGTA